MGHKPSHISDVKWFKSVYTFTNEKINPENISKDKITKGCNCFHQERPLARLNNHR